MVEAPEITHANHSDDAAIPSGSLTRGFLRAQFPVTALTTASPLAASAAVGATQGVDDGTFWVFAACADKSIRRSVLMQMLFLNSLCLATVLAGTVPKCTSHYTS